MPSSVRTIAVPGGDLAVELLPGTTEPVLAIHGISSTRKLWGWLRAEAPSLSLIAPDLRGRGDSLEVAGPSSIPQHAADLIAVLDALGLDAVHICGMSMGGFVAVELAAAFPDRVKSLVLVDGGVPMRTPPGMTRENTAAVFADRMSRLDKVWPSSEEYAAFFRANTAPLIDPADEAWADYVAHDLRDGRAKLSGQAVTDDAVSVFFSPSRLAEVTVPMRWLYAEWSSGEGSAPAYSPEMVAEVTPLFASVTELPGLDHAGTVMTRKGAAIVASVIEEALA